MRTRFFALSLAVLFTSLAGCAGDDTNVGAPADGGGSDAAHADATGGGVDSSASDSATDSSTSDSGSDAATDAGNDADAASTTINGCGPNDFVNQVDAGTPTITFPNDPLPAQ